MVKGLTIHVKVAVVIVIVVWVLQVVATWLSRSRSHSTRNEREGGASTGGSVGCGLGVAAWRAKGARATKERLAIWPAGLLRRKPAEHVECLLKAREYLGPVVRIDRSVLAVAVHVVRW